MEGGVDLSFPDADDDDSTIEDIVQNSNSVPGRPRPEPSRVNTVVHIRLEEDRDRIFVPRSSCENVRWSVPSQNSIVH